MTQRHGVETQNNLKPFIQVVFEFNVPPVLLTFAVLRAPSVCVLHFIRVCPGNWEIGQREAFYLAIMSHSDNYKTESLLPFKYDVMKDMEIVPDCDGCIKSFYISRDKIMSN